MKRSQLSKKKASKESSWKFFVLVAALLLITVGSSYFYFKPKFAFESPFISDIQSQQSQAAEENAEAISHDLYRNGSSDYYEEEFREDTFLVIAEDVITKYIKSYNILLLDLYMDRAGVIYIDLSGGLLKNFKGDAIEEFNIVAGLYSRVKTAVPGFKALKILIQGKEVDSFGGHIDISKPIGDGISAGVR